MVEGEKAGREGEEEILILPQALLGLILPQALLGLILPQALLGSLRSPISLGACSQATKLQKVSTYMNHCRESLLF